MIITACIQVDCPHTHGDPYESFDDDGDAFCEDAVDSSYFESLRAKLGDDLSDEDSATEEPC